MTTSCSTTLWTGLALATCLFSQTVRAVGFREATTYVAAAGTLTFDADEPFKEIELVLLNDSLLSVQVEGGSAMQYPLQVSDDLSTWTTIGSIHLSEPVETVPLPVQSTPDRRRFYRVLVQPAEP